MKEIKTDNIALKIILACSDSIKQLKDKNSILKTWFTQKKIKNIKIRKKKLHKNFKAVVCAIPASQKEINGLALILYKDLSGIFLFILLFFIVFLLNPKFLLFNI